MTVTFGFWPFTSSHSSSKHNSESPYYYWNGDWYSSNSPYGYYRGVAYTSPAAPAAPAAPALPPTPYFPPYGYGWGGGFYGGYGGFGYPFFPGPTRPTPDVPVPEPHEPGTEEPHTTEPGTEEPHTTEPRTEEPHTTEPTTGEPHTIGPGTEPGFTLPFPTVTYPENSPGPVLPPYGLNPFSTWEGGHGPVVNDPPVTYPTMGTSDVQADENADHGGAETIASGGEGIAAFGNRWNLAPSRNYAEALSETEYASTHSQDKTQFGYSNPFNQ